MDDATLFRRAFGVALVLGVLSRLIVLRIVNKQQPTQPQDYIEQLILSFIAAALGAIAFPALLDKEFAALTFLAVGIQQFQEVASEEEITLSNIDDSELIRKGITYIHDVSKNYEVRNYLSIFSSLAASIAFITIFNTFKANFIICTISSIVATGVVGYIFKKILANKSLEDIVDVEVVPIEFDGALLKVGGVVLTNIGLETSKQRYLEKGIGLKVIPKDMVSAGIIGDPAQQQAMLHNVYLHMGIDRDVDEPEFIPIARTNPKDNSVNFGYIPLVRDVDLTVEAIKSAPILDSSKGNNNAYRKKNKNKQN
ncbi:MAG: YIEGIA domain-containing protein [Paraclostridium bifermentans]|uniref:YIEGIA domain-containing protein n=1 Tax=Paraclostridium TaxID=1849822 RepID=UPI00051DF73D|nr:MULTISPECIES: YIEGIA domain-containing protein [Paraclostridium]KGJ50362.1 membrane protein [Clostridium sp. NCR]MBS6507687.1 YIEGIA domain-containing protein [Paraclostridium bifermentans]MCU9811618.1 YIEGIA family protein [Paraclostridium sp. AKS81]MDU3802578.1 YIEGIA domain-containing protein [Paraclostridium bifermentans]